MKILGNSDMLRLNPPDCLPGCLDARPALIFFRNEEDPNNSNTLANNDSFGTINLFDKAFDEEGQSLIQIVFHELGHCVLVRDHLDDADSEGNCLSMMHSGLGDCEFRYNGSTRNVYLDELFSR